MKLKTVIKIPTEIYSRIVGYFRPVHPTNDATNTWNPGKRQEFKDRKKMDITKFKVKEK